MQLLLFSGETPEKPTEKETDKEEEETTAESEESQTETADTGILTFLAIAVVWIHNISYEDPDPMIFGLIRYFFHCFK